jgi:hypothetical protein
MRIKKIMRAVLLFLAMIAPAALITACDDTSGSASWSNLYGMEDWVLSEFSIAGLADGGSILFGKGWRNSSNDSGSFLIKLDKSGAIVWQKKISGYTESDSFRVTGEGDIYVGGRYAHYDPNSGVFTSGGFSLIKVDRDGAIIWKKQYSTADELSRVDVNLDEARGMAYVEARIEASTSYIYNILLGKITLDGVPQWQKYIRSEYMMYQYHVNDIIVLPDGGCVIGFANRLLRFNQAGQVVWSKSYTPTGGLQGSSGDASSSITMLENAADGNLVAGGNYFNYAENKDAISLMKIDTNGVVIWSGELLNITEDLPNSTSSDVAYPVDMHMTSDGGYALIGNRSITQRYEYSLNTHTITRDSGWMIKFDNAWNVSWQKIYKEKAQSYTGAGDPADHLETGIYQVLEFESLGEAADGGYVIAGTMWVHPQITTKINENDGPALVVKTSNKGAVANTRLIIKNMSAKVGAITVSTAAASCPIEDVSSAVSDVSAASTDVVFYSFGL